MDLLFKREQTTGKIGRVNFKLWAKIELDETEKALVSRYKFDQSQILEETQDQLKRKSAILGLAAAFVAYLIFSLMLSSGVASLLAVVAGGAAGYWFYNEKREVLFMRDLMHGRHFTCTSIIDLAKKEARLAGISGVLRQVLESAKHWDGTERHTIEALPKEEARQVMLNAF